MPPPPVPLWPPNVKEAVSAAGHTRQSEKEALDIVELEHEWPFYSQHNARIVLCSKGLPSAAAERSESRAPNVATSAPSVVPSPAANIVDAMSTTTTVFSSALMTSMTRPQSRGCAEPPRHHSIVRPAMDDVLIQPLSGAEPTGRKHSILSSRRFPGQFFSCWGSIDEVNSLLRQEVAEVIASLLCDEVIEGWRTMEFILPTRRRGGLRGTLS